MNPYVVEVLSADEARTVRDQVHELRPYWTRHGAAEFYTLGVSSYLEAQYRGAVAYALAVKRQNPILDGLFWGVYERIRLALESVVGEPVVYPPRLARPGFQIFLADPAFESPVCSLHVDQPYKHLSWQSWEAVDIGKTLSFTLALSIPKSGAGLLVWPQIAPADALVGPPLHDQIRGLEPVVHVYAPGRMVVHDGHSVHQIAPFRTVDAGDERITLQGHGIRGAMGWMLYF